MGYIEFINGIDALVMGRNTFEKVCSFDIDWPYDKPVFVLSNSLKEISENYKDKAFLVKGSLNEVLKQINNKGFYSLYIDGDSTIQNFLSENLIDHITITTIPILLGDGIPLFNTFNKKLNFKLISSKIYINQLVQSHYKKTDIK